MLKKITHFFEKQFSIEATSEADRQHQLNLAVAALLTEVAAADNEISEAEKNQVKQLLREQLKLPEDEIEELQSMSLKELEQATDYYQFTSLIKDNLDAAQRLEIIEQLWQIALADGRIDHHEEHFIRKIADLLFVPHSAYIKAKLKVINR